MAKKPRTRRWSGQRARGVDRAGAALVLGHICSCGTRSRRCGTATFRLFFGGQLISLTGTWMQSTAQGWLVYELTGSKMLLGIVTAVGSAPDAVFSVWGGSLADRHPKRRILARARRSR